MQKLFSKLLVILIIFQTISPINFIGQVFAISTNISYPLNVTELGGGTFSWSSTPNAIGNTTSNYTSNNITTKNAYTNFLSVTNFNLGSMGLPSGAIINGIKVDIENSASNNNGMKDTTIQLTKDGNIGVGNNYGNNINRAKSVTTTTYGGLTDLWGTTWSSNELLNSNFGVLLQYRNTNKNSRTINVHRIGITIDYTVVNNPGGVSSGLQFWLKADKGTSTTVDGNSLTTWSDQSTNGFDATAGIAPTYLNNTTQNINFNPYIDFNGTDQYMENLNNGAYSQSYFAVVVPDNTVNAALTGEVPFGLDCNSGVLSAGTCGLTFGGLNLGAFTAAINDEVITHAIGSSLDWRSAQIGLASYEANQPMLININENITGDGTEISEKGLTLDNYNANSYQSLSTADYRIGMSTDPTYPFPYNGKIAEIINYNSRTTPLDKQKIESYLSIKYGITLNSGIQNYIFSDGITNIWSTSTAGIYINDIFGIARDDSSELGQIKSKSVNNDNVITIEAIGEGTNIANSFVDIDNLEGLTISNNDLGNTWSALDAPIGYYNLTRKWKTQETGEIGDINIDFDVGNINFDIPNLNVGTNYYFTYDSNNNSSLADEIPIIMTNISGNIWQALGINLNNGMIFTISTQASSNNIPTDITLSNNIIDENSAVGTNVGNLTTSDLDITDTHTYSFVAGAGDGDNGLFTLSGNVLSTNDYPDFEIKNSYSIRVETNDGNGGTFQKEFTININNTIETTNSIIDFEDIYDENKYSVTSGNWTRINNISLAQEGNYSLESQNNGLPNTQTCFQIDNTFTDIGTVEFQYKVSSQVGTDFLKFYIDDIEQQAWSGEVGYSLYSDNTITSGTHTYKWCYIKDGTIDTGNDKSWIDYITFNDTPLDTIAPIISSTNISENQILPGGNHNIEFNYSDEGGGSGIDNTSNLIIFEKWNGSSWVINTNISQSSITTTKTTYNTSNLDFGKYKATFNISDITGNTSSNFVRVFYIDKPEMNISSDNVNIGGLNNTNNSFGNIIVTVKTIGAGFNVKLKKNQTLNNNNSSDLIPYYDGTFGIGYDKNNDGNLFDYNNDIIGQEALNINTNGDLNTYTYIVKMGAISQYQQVSGNYTGKIDFDIELNY